MLLHMLFETMDGSQSGATKQPPNSSSNPHMIALSDNSVSSASVSEDENSVSKEVSTTSRSSYHGQGVVESVAIGTSKNEQKTMMFGDQQDVAATSMKSNATSPPTIALNDIMTQSNHLPRLLPFPYRLHHMLNDVEKRGNSHIVSWMPTGRSFKVHKPTEFVSVHGRNGRREKVFGLPLDDCNTNLAYDFSTSSDSRLTRLRHSIST